MPDIGGAISVGASLLGGAMGSDAASSAADTQSEAAKYSADLQRQMFNRNVALQSPFYRAGVGAENRLLTMLGITPQAPSRGDIVTQLAYDTPNWDKLDQAAKDKLVNAELAKQTANIAAMSKSPEFGSLMRDFSMKDFQADPGYGFRMSEGLKALDRTAAARGGLMSGAALKGAERYGQDLASQEYQNAFNRYQTNRANKLNPLQSLTGQGQTTANTLGTAGQNYATNAGEAYMGGANARASGYIGSANAWSNALGQAANTYSQNKILGQILGNTGGVSGGFGSGTAAIPQSQSLDYYLGFNG